MTTVETLHPSLFSVDRPMSGMSKDLPILSNSAHPHPSPLAISTPGTSGVGGDPMDVSPTDKTPHDRSMGPPHLSNSPSANSDTSTKMKGSSDDRENSGNPNSNNGGSAPAVGAAAAAQQPKVVQTAFIHKLYSMLEDQTIQHLISWSSSNESFVMSPSTEFSKVLASYFKHTNISSFVRQLNMYGFHKVSDVFHTGSPDAPLWEFKHGAGNFKRGDLVGLREIKRRASRHALIHRDSFSGNPKPAPSAPPTPAEPMPDPIDQRITILEHNFYDVHARLARTEDQCASLASKNQSLLEGLLRCHQWNNNLARQLMTMVPDAESPIHREVYAMQQEINSHIETLKCLEESHDQFMPNGRPPVFSTPNYDQPAPASPRQMPMDERRRPSLPGVSASRSSPFRTPVPPHLAISPRRYGSIGTANSAYSPSSLRGGASQAAPPPPPPPPPPPSGPHPLSTVTSPPAGLPRRHTSADIRLTPGWNGGPPQSSPHGSGNSSSAWPSSPHRNPQPPTPASGDQQLRDALSRYELPKGPASGGTPRNINTAIPPGGSRNPTPPLSGEGTTPSGGFNSENGWALPGARFPLFKGVGLPLGDSAPATRRSSMASNVHNLLNPAETAERAGEEGDDSREGKRKRVT